MVKIIVDSTADLHPRLQNVLDMVPLTVHFGDEEYLDSVTLGRKEFYQKLIESDILPKTSQPTPAAFAEVFERVTANGDTAVMLTLSSVLSGTYQSAMLAAQDFEGKVYVVDTLSAAIGIGILADLAYGMAEAGMGAKEIAEKIEEEKKNVRVIALLDTLEYLKKGGRISSVAAFAGGLLSIKPVIHVEDGKVEVIGKARGSKQGNNLLVQEIQKAGGVDFAKPVMLGYTGLSDALLQKYVDDSRHIWAAEAKELPVAIIGSAIGTHVGPGGIAVAFFAKN